MAVNYFAHPCSGRKNREINLQTWCLKNQLIEHSANNANIEMLVVGQPMTHTAGRPDEVGVLEASVRPRNWWMFSRNSPVQVW